MADYYSNLDRTLAYQSGYQQQPAQQYSRPPVYSPFQNRHNIDDSFSYLANMYGPGIVQAFAGPDAFLMHQMPGQATADQHSAAQYQRHVVSAVSNANTRGNAEVAQKLAGVQSLINNGQPITQLDREHAQTGAAVFNNPLFKGIAENYVPGGRDALEGVMFGRRGDPAAIASAVGRMGFYRPDVTGGKKMSAESMEMFSSQLHGQLYGENANLDEMHGFGAHATGEMMQDLFQQGRLPRSIGSLSAADRVKALSASKRDDQTMTALAKDFAHSDLMSRDYDYASATGEEQKRMLENKVGGYKDKLNNVFQEADKFRNNDPRAKSAAEIEQLSGFSAAANGVDAQRTSKVLKDYNGAISAIRELFGDNGKSNAPVAALMAGLNQLTNGAQMNMSPAKVESTVREIRLAARDAGISDEQVMGMSRMMHQRGAMLGLQPGNVMDEMKSAINYSKAMDDQGVFAKSGWGKLDKAQANARQEELLQRGDASYGGRALAVLNRLSTENKEQFKGTELAAAAEAYRKGEETYEYDGKTVNLMKIAGQQGVKGILDVAKRSKAGMDQIDAAFNDEVGTQEYLKSGYAYNAQKYQLEMRLGQQNKQKLLAKTGASGFAGKFKPAGMSDKEFREKTHDLVTGFSFELSDIVLNETADMSVDDRAATMERRGKEELVKYFRSDAGGKLGEKAAEKRAEEYFNEFYGATPEARKAAMNTAYSEMNAISTRRTGMAVSAQQQLRKDSTKEQALAEETINAKRADRVKAMSAGNETTMSQRLGEELDRAASGDTGTRNEAIARLTHVLSTDKMLQQYAPDAQDALAYAGKMYSESTVTEEKIAKLSAAATANPNGPEQQKLMALAGYAKDHKLTDAEKSSLVPKARMRSVGNAEGATDAERAANTARQQRADILFKAYNVGDKDSVTAGATALAQETLGTGANKNDVQAFATAALDENPREFERRVSRLPKEQQESVRSTAAFLRAAQKFGGLSRAGLEQSGKTVEEAAGRPIAETNKFKEDISSGLKNKLMPEINNREYTQLRRDKFGADTEMGRIKGEAVVRQLSNAITNVVVDEMGGAENATPAARTQFLEKRSKEELKKYFVSEGNTEARAEQMAEQHFTALLGSDEKERQRKLDVAYTTTSAEAKRQGFDPESAAQRRNAAIAAERATDAAADATISPSKDGMPAKYDYKKLGVTDRVTPEQQELIDNVKRNPTGAYVGSLMRDEKSKKLLLSLPDNAAVELFQQFSPAEQEKGVGLIKQGANAKSAFSKSLVKSYADIDLSVQDQQNLERVHTALTRNGGLSSNNVQQNSGAPYGPQDNGANQRNNLPRAMPPNTETEIIQEQLAAIESRATDNWWTPGRSFKTDADEKQHKQLSQRRAELASGNPLGHVQKEMAAINSRKRTGIFGGKTLNTWDTARYEELEKREKAILTDGGAVVQQNAAGVNATQSAAGGTRSGAAAATGGNRGAEAMKVSGTLTLNGLQEAILSAIGQRMEETPDGGAPISLGAPTGR